MTTLQPRVRGGTVVTDETDGRDGRTRRNERLRGLRAERAEIPLNGGDAGILWAEYSRYPAEAGIAGRRYKQLTPHYTDPWALLMAVAEAAFEGHHAAGCCRGEYLRSRAARIRETVHEESNARQTFSPAHGRLRSISDILTGTP